MDEVGVRRHVVLPCRKAAPCRLDGSPPNPSEAPSARSPRLRTAARRAYVPRCGTRDAPVPRVVERESSESRANAAATPTRAGRRGAVVCSVAGERRSSRKRAGQLRYDLQCGGDPSGVIREPAEPLTWRGIEYRSRRVSAGVGSGLVRQCLRRPSVGGPLRGDEESGEPNADNKLDALHRGWRGARATYIANRCFRTSNAEARPTVRSRQFSLNGAPVKRFSVPYTEGPNSVADPANSLAARHRWACWQRCPKRPTPKNNGTIRMHMAKEHRSPTECIVESVPCRSSANSTPSHTRSLRASATCSWSRMYTETTNTVQPCAREDLLSMVVSGARGTGYRVWSLCP